MIKKEKKKVNGQNKIYIQKQYTKRIDLSKQKQYIYINIQK